MVRTAAANALFLAAVAIGSGVGVAGCGQGSLKGAAPDASGAGGMGVSVGVGADAAAGDGGGGSPAPDARGGVPVGVIAACPQETNPPAEFAARCLQCLTPFENPRTDGCCNIMDEVGLALCQAASACMRANGCNISGDVTTCFCGTTGTAACSQPGRANGPCVDDMTAAAARNVETATTDAPTPAVVWARFGDPAYALGRAVNIQGVAGAFCSAECGFPPR